MFSATLPEISFNFLVNFLEAIHYLSKTIKNIVRLNTAA